jgi:OHCU decarboxylase
VALCLGGEQSVSNELDRLNSLSPADAQAEFLKCCGATLWAKRMSKARPFGSVEQLCSKADETWASLAEYDWLEAFRAHPKIGEKKAATNQTEQAAGWSAQEQSQAQQAADETRAAIARANKVYEDRFGFIFIICASGKSADEILSALNQRLSNDTHTELLIAANEQQKITRLRLQKLLGLD